MQTALWLYTLSFQYHVFILFSIHFSDSKSWSVSRSGYSYSDPVNQIPPQDNNFDDILGRNSTSSKEDDDRIQRKNVLNSKLRMAGGKGLLSHFSLLRMGKDGLFLLVPFSGGNKLTMPIEVHLSSVETEVPDTSDLFTWEPF